MSHNEADPSQVEQTTQAADPEVVAVAKRRKFNNAYKLRILEEAEQCIEPGQVGALLRREGLYSSHLTRWRKWRKKLQDKFGSDEKGASKHGSNEAELLALKLENEQLRKQLETAELIISVQKKLSRLLGLTQETTKDESK
jgi:transposase